MKNLRVDIRLYVIIPLIFAGISAFSMLMAYHLALLIIQKRIYPEGWFVFIVILVLLTSAACGILIVRTLLKPVKAFIKEAEKMGVVKREKSSETPKKPDEITHYTNIFEQVTQLLGKMEAKTLFPDIIGQSNSVRKILSLIMRIAPTDSSVLILGESGTGKELVAKSLHRHSQRSNEPFVALNCASIPENLLESELFGHEKGAFTGADRRKIGKFERANGGTLFLDEIADMSLETQSKILRAIQEQQFERVGGSKPINVNVRFIAATNKDIKKCVSDGRFREDLFFRINVFSIFLPPLRERREDIPLLVDHFLASDKNNPKKPAPETIPVLMAHPWPGNIRELKNAVEAASIMADDLILPIHLPASCRDTLQLVPTEENIEEFNLEKRLATIEKGLILHALEQTGGIQVKAAEVLGIKERSLWHRIKKHEIDVSTTKN